MSDANETQVTLELSDRTIVLIGTAHVSKESVEEVRRFIRDEKPALVCVEIDSIRYNAMTQNENWEKLDIVKVIREGKGFLLLANLVLSSFQRRMGSELGVKPGEEMSGAVDAARELGIPFAFCDREVQITLRRVWAGCNFWSKCKLLSVLFASAFSSEKLSEEEIENLKNNAELDGMMQELAKYLPDVKKTLIDERDLFMASSIWSSGTTMTSGERPKIVAVMGAGHLHGVKAHIEQFEESGGAAADIGPMNTAPKRGGIARYAGWIIPALIVALIGVGFYTGGPDKAGDELVKWLVLNGGFAALGSLLAFANVVTVVAAFVSAPIGTLNPFLSVGVFAAVVQAFIRKPRVSDAQTLAADVCKLRGLYRNRIAHILLIFFLSSLGGVAGNILTLTPAGEAIFKAASALWTSFF
ncbi:MAG: TraB/GumN family protein [Spirochaetaceae bacterium]|jgi:pheromone shutdown-related protein TraB|nr:TraB/GumN family protein [Spirochaetaceae bacterium]